MIENEGLLKKEEVETVKESIMQKEFKFFGLLSLIYACLFTFCLYDNQSGITMSLFVAGTLYYFYLCMKKLGVTRKKDGYFYEVAILLLGCSTWLTADGRIIAMNYLGIFILLISFMIHEFFVDKEWDVLHYMENFIETLFGTLGCIPQPFSHFMHMLKFNKNEKNEKRQYVIKGLMISVPFVILILVLLSSADFVFANSMDVLFRNIVIPENLIVQIIMMIFGFLASYCFIAYLAMDKREWRKGKRKQGEPIIAITFTSLIAFIYLLFCMIQVVYLFMGKMQLPNDYTYAQYAREGFFQLVVVCLINLALVLFCIYYYKDHKVLKFILSTISFCTYIMIASSAYRMTIYIGQYNLTFLRVFVLWALVVIFAMLTGIMILILKPNFPFLKYTIYSLTSLSILFSFSHPDYLIAKYNFAQYSFVNQGIIKPEVSNVQLSNRELSDSEISNGELLASERIYSDILDTDYLNELCADAAPAILEFTEKLKKENKLSSEELSSFDFHSYFSRIYQDGNDLNIRTFNLSKYIGKNVANEFLEN